MSTPVGAILAVSKKKKRGGGNSNNDNSSQQQQQSSTATTTTSSKNVEDVSSPSQSSTTSASTTVTPPSSFSFLSSASITTSSSASSSSSSMINIGGVLLPSSSDLRTTHPLSQGLSRVSINSELVDLSPFLFPHQFVMFSSQQQQQHSSAVSSSSAAAAAASSSSCSGKEEQQHQQLTELNSEIDQLTTTISVLSPFSCFNDQTRNISNKKNKILTSIPIPLSRRFLSSPHVIATWVERPNFSQQAGVPRGLINGSNACFVASVLQILLQVPGFCSTCVAAAFAYTKYYVARQVVEKLSKQLEDKKKYLMKKIKENEKKEEENEKEQEQEQEKVNKQQTSSSSSQSNKKNKNKKKNSPSVDVDVVDDDDGKSEISNTPSSTNTTTAIPILSKLSAPKMGSDSQEPTASLLGRWMMNYWQNSNTPLALPSLRLSGSDNSNNNNNSSTRTTTIMSGAIQQDAHEFLQLLLERINEDCKQMNLSFTSEKISSSSSSNQQNTSSSHQTDKIQQRIQKATEIAAAEGAGGGKKKSKSKQNTSSSSNWTVVGQGTDKIKFRKQPQHENQFVESSQISLFSEDEQHQHQNQQKQQDSKTSTSTTTSTSAATKLLFGGEFYVHVKGGEGIAPEGKAARLLEPFLMLMCHVSSGKSVMECISKSLAKEKVDSSSSSQQSTTAAASSSSSSTTTTMMTKQTHIATAPQYALFVHLTRWAMTNEGDVIKLDNTIKIDNVVTLKYQKNASSSSSSQQASSSTATYRIRAASCHRGRSPGAGHYVTYVWKHSNEEGFQAQNSNNNSKPMCWCADDSRVTSISDLTIPEKDSPYLLMYVRES